MKLYDFSIAPNPRRVRIFLAEKGIEVPTVQVNLREREQFEIEFSKINPWLTVPVLELDDGTIISECVAISRYFEDTIPEPPLWGRDAMSPPRLRRAGGLLQPHQSVSGRSSGRSDDVQPSIAAEVCVLEVEARHPLTRARYGRSVDVDGVLHEADGPSTRVLEPHDPTLTARAPDHVEIAVSVEVHRL